MSGPTYNWKATAAFSLEGVVADELKRLNMDKVLSDAGCVHFCGTMDDALRANLCLRTADRVMLEVADFQALSFDELFEGIRALRWEDYLPRDAQILVRGACARSQLMSVRDVQAIAKKAIVERMKAAYRMEWLPEAGAAYTVDVHIHKDRVALCLDASGEGLSRRGYRTWRGEAPLRESMAAAVALLSPWRGTSPLIDPMCGTGTIAIEAAMIAMNKAPGLGRAFAMEGWKQAAQLDSQGMRAALRAQETAVQAPIVAADSDPDVLVLARRHCKAAGIGQAVQIVQCDVRHMPSDQGKGDVLVNPPYGERLGDGKSALASYRALREGMDGRPNWNVTALTCNPGFEKAYGRRADKRRRLFNGRLECELLRFFPKGVR